MHSNQLFIEKSEKILRTRPKGCCYLLYLDITDFQYINFCYGTEAGDRLLQAVNDYTAGLPFVLLCERLYSDYFLCILSFPGETPDEKAVQAVEHSLNGFMAEQQKLYPACKLRFACGLCRTGTQELSHTIESANLARKEAKRLDTGSAVLYSEELVQKTVTRYELEQTMNQVVREQRFCFYLQPKVDLTNGRIIGAEALARRIEQDGTVIYPDSFLPVMESSGTVVELDLLICRQVCAFLSGRIRQGLPVVRTSVNLSRLHIKNKDTASSLHAIAQEYQISPELLEFELTETILLDELTGAKKLIDQLRTYGYRVSIDDFGSGYAGINIWQELNFDCLKLDGCFLSEDPELKKKNEALVPNIINIGHRLGISILCEGVETAGQCTYLTRLGCTTVQGFYFSHPIAPDVFYDIYRKQNGCYPLPFRNNHNTDRTAHESGGLPKSDVDPSLNPSLNPKCYIPLSLCSLFMAVCVILATIFYQHIARDEFNELVLENLDSCMNGQKAEILSGIESMSSTLRNLSVLISQRGDSKRAEEFLQPLNKGEPPGKYSWLSAANIEQAEELFPLTQDDQTAALRLKKGETVISNLIPSHRPDNLYYYAVAVPVFENGAFSGAICGTVNAQSLTGTSLYSTAHGSVIGCFITDGSGTVLPSAGGKEYATLAGCVAKLNIRPDAHSSDIATVLSAPSGNWKLGTGDRIPFYLSRADLGINDWHVTVLYRADKAAARSNRITTASLYFTAALFTAIILIYLIIFLYMKKIQKKFSMEEQRYLLLEQFSDTVLFDYDCLKDTIRFTPNADRLFKIHDLVQHNYLHGLDVKYIYAGDMEIIQSLLMGQSVQKEIRIRLLHPTEDRYFWCLAQFRYLFEHDTLVSVVGKITDIDEQKLHEDYLIEISEKDGLTGLRNRASAEAKIRESIQNGADGTLLMIDVDNFKQINDQFGHTAGDSALIFLADCLQKTFRSNDILGRAGGDELIAYMEGVCNRNIAQKKVELLMYYIRQSTSQGLPFISVSIGIALCPDNGMSYEELFTAADQAMYEAKNRGKMQAQFYEDMA